MTEPTTLVAAWKAAQGELKAARIDSPAIDARLLLEAATGASRLEILTDPHRPLTSDQSATLAGYIERRLRREPVSRILGRKGFWKIMLNVTPDVLSPRPDTETILDVAMLAFEPAQAFSGHQRLRIHSKFLARSLNTGRRDGPVRRVPWRTVRGHPFRPRRPPTHWTQESARTCPSSTSDSWM